MRPSLDGEWFEPGTEGYDDATSPFNSSAAQRPRLVAAVKSAQDVARCVRHASERQLKVAVQATGHGAARTIDSTFLLIDTRGLERVEVDADRRVARVGAGVTWGSLNGAAGQHGLVGLAGTAPTVGVVGYCCKGGWGWLTRSHGLASVRLRAVEFVDGRGAMRRADDTCDGDVLWAYRGGGGIGVATAIEIELVDAPKMQGGYLLWPGGELDDVAAVWSSAVRELTSSMSTVLSLLRLPEDDAIPKELQGQQSAYLGVVAVNVESAAELKRLRAALPAPVADTIGPLDQERLANIHLDPPTAVPARGDGRWLSAFAPEVATQALLAARALGDDSPLAEVEIRHLAAPRSAVSGALVESPGPFLFHANGPATNEQQATRLDDALTTITEALAPADLGRSAAAFRDGRREALGALTTATVEELARVRVAHDPDHLVLSGRDLLDPNGLGTNARSDG